MKRKIAASTLAVALAVGGLVWASPAMAEESADPAPVVEQTEAPPAPETAPAEGPAQSTVTETTDNTEDASPEKTKPEQKDHKWYVCKYVGTPGVDERLQEGGNPVFVDEHSIATFPNVKINDSFADKQGRSVVIAGPFEKKQNPEPGVDQCPPPRVPVKVTPPVPTFNDPCGVNNLTVATVETAGVVWSINQVGNKTKVAATAAEGYVLEGPASWEFTDSGVLCPPTIGQCEVMNPATKIGDTEGMYFEDRTGGAHELVTAGLAIRTFGDDLSQAKSAGYVPVSVPFAEVGNPTLDYEVVSGQAAGLNLVIYKDGAWFGTLVHEPLFADWWINKPVPGMSAGPNAGYQKAYGTLQQFMDAFHNAGWTVEVKAVGYSLGSGAIGEGIVKSLTIGCDVFTFGLPVEGPEIVTPPAPQFVDPCGLDNAYWSYVDEEGDGWHFNALPTGELILTADEGYAFPEGTVTWWQDEDSGEECVTTPEPEVVTLGIPQFTDVCGTADDEGSLPEDTEGVHYNWASDDTESADYWAVRATVAEGYVVEDVPEGWESIGEGEYKYAHTMSAEPCPTPTPTTPTTPTKPVTPAGLASTGGGDVNPILPLAGGLTVALGITLMLMRRFARR